MAGIRSEVRDGVGYLILDHAERRNATNFAMYSAIPGVVDELATDDTVRAVVVRGAGDKAFSAGADISEFGERRSSDEGRAEYDAASSAAYAAMRGFEKPTIAMLRGFCVGGGAEVALLQDIRIGAEDLRFGVTPARLGLGYDLGDTQLLVDSIGPAFAKELLFSGELLNADDALRMGFVNRIVPADEIEDAVHGFARTIAERAPLTVKAAKAIVGEAAKENAARDRDLCSRLVADCYASEDYIEGQRAFAEKRKPNFKGR